MFPVFSAQTDKKNLPAMKTNYKLYIAACALALLSACGNNSTSTESAITTVALTGNPAGNAPVAPKLAVDAYTPPASSQQPVSPMKARNMRTAPPATHIALGAPLASMAAKANAGAGKPFQIGFGRDVAQTATATATRQVLQWHTTETGGQVAAINFNSTGAKGLRIGLLVTQLPASATLRFYAKGAATAHEVKGAKILGILAANLAAGDKSDAGRTYWGPVVEGIDATVEIELPPGVATGAVDVAIPSVSHMFMSMKEGSAIAPLATYAAPNHPKSLSCQVDVSCTAPLPAASNAVLWLLFQENGSSYICSGTVLSNTANNGIPYVLTANHCISNQTVASTLYSESNYRSASCDATSGNYFATDGTSAALLYTAYNTDSTLLRLNGTLPAGVLYAGWDATTVAAVNTTITGIHHPYGDAQRLSRGVVDGYYTRVVAAGVERFELSDAANSTILSVNLTTGIVQPGSSGSGLFKGADSNPQLVGMLYGGVAAACETPTTSKPQATVYGRFDVAFNAGMSDWLTQGVKTVAQLYNASTGVHYYTIGVTDASNVVSANVGYSNQGSSFTASSVPAAGLSPVHRFFNTSNGTYFYTISEKERAAVAANTPRMRNDGVVWYASATAAAGTVPLYSAFNSATGSQFFTTSSAALSSLIAANPQFKTDGIAFYVAP